MVLVEGFCIGEVKQGTCRRLRSTLWFKSQVVLQSKPGFLVESLSLSSLRVLSVLTRAVVKTSVFDWGPLLTVVGAVV